MNSLDRYIEIANKYIRAYNKRFEECKHYTHINIDHILYKYIHKDSPEYEDIGSEELYNCLCIMNDVGSWNAVQYIAYPFNKKIIVDYTTGWIFERKYPEYAQILYKARSLFDKRNKELELIKIKQHQDEFNELKEKVKKLTIENQLLKEQNLVLERIYNPNIKYNYTELEDRISVFKQELLSTTRIFNRIFKSRSLIPVGYSSC